MAIKRLGRLDEILEAHIAPAGTPVPENKLLAAGFAVVDRNNVLYSGAAGHLGFDSDSEKYTEDSVSWEASLTKLVTAVCLLQLVDRGLIGLDEDAGSYVPELKQIQILTNSDEAGKPVLKENTKPVTLRHLLTHTAGLGYTQIHPRLTAWAKAESRSLGSRPRDLNHYTTPLAFAPGEGWVYGTGYDWAGQVLEKVAGQRLSAYMQEHIFKPLGMSSTAFHSKDIRDVEKRMTAVSRRSHADGYLRPIKFSRDPAEGDMDSGGAGLVGTLADYAKFLQAILQGKLLSQKIADEMFAPQLDAQQRAEFEKLVTRFADMMIPEFDADTPMDHGLAGVINTRDVPGKRCRGSMQWSGMLNSRWWIDREAGIAAVFFTSVLPTGDPVVNKVYDELERAVYSELSQLDDLPRM